MTWSSFPVLGHQGSSVEGAREAWGAKVKHKGQAAEEQGLTRAGVREIQRTEGIF